MDSTTPNTKIPFIGRQSVSSHDSGTQFQDGYSKGLILFANTITTGIADKFFLKLWGQLGIVLILFIPVLDTYCQRGVLLVPLH